ncbi:ankyrin repeat domain-containing protein [Pontixanthobacter aquaemixtae]|uniref:Ankyrin repeat domain-containing protein n=1 Tax=Pontixanthobacter aquaemixtae TaxID=1958940 RepID=A0A844ZPQ5_9SPHN|nr:ankyrin repeat domain-containing protein [Pontixanthobacter aquaemixtae]MXO89332.1 ankyrin repeat domain-containing protein [Pontixanthobacter aquaemixtae]
MARAVFRTVFPGLALAIASSLAVVAAPASAQFKSKGYAFLEAVEDRDGNVVTEALKEPGSVIVNTRDITTGETALHIVTKRRDLMWIRFLTQNGANPNISDNKGVSPLQIATQLGFVEGVEALIKAGARVDVSNDAGETPLISAVHRRDAGMVRLLLAQGANPDQNDNSGRSARIYAELQTANSALMAEFKRADEAREGQKETQTYGPSF